MLNVVYKVNCELCAMRAKKKYLQLIAVFGLLVSKQLVLRA